MARGRKSLLVIVLSPTAREILERWQRSTTIAAGLARRGKMILLLADRYSPSQVAQLAGVQRGVVRQGARRFLAQLCSAKIARSSSCRFLFQPVFMV